MLLGSLAGNLRQRGVSVNIAAENSGLKDMVDIDGEEGFLVVILLRKLVFPQPPSEELRKSLNFLFFSMKTCI